MKGNIGYLILLLMAIGGTLVSIIMEGLYPIVGDHGSHDLTRTILYRILHFYIFFYCGLYLVFFRPIGLDSYIYLIFNLVLNIQWCILRCCILSYWELVAYGCDYREFSTKFHPYIYAVLREWSDWAMDLVGVAILVNIGAILFYNTKIPIFTKLLYIGVFSYIVWVCCTGRNPIVEHDGFGGNKVLAIKAEIARVDGLYMYPSDPDSWFMKLVA